MASEIMTPAQRCWEDILTALAELQRTEIVINALSLAEHLKGKWSVRQVLYTLTVMSNQHVGLVKYAYVPTETVDNSDRPVLYSIHREVRREPIAERDDTNGNTNHREKSSPRKLVQDSLF